MREVNKECRILFVTLNKAVMYFCSNWTHPDLFAYQISIRQLIKPCLNLRTTLIKGGDNIFKRVIIIAIFASLYATCSELTVGRRKLLPSAYWKILVPRTEADI